MAKTIKLTLSDDPYTDATVEVEVPYYETPDAALIVHRPVVSFRGEISTLKNSWRITHKPTGLHIFSGYTRRADAMEAAAELAKLTDWQKITLDNCGAFYTQNEARMLELKRSVR